MAAFASGEWLMAALRAGSPLRVGDVTLVPVERVRIRSDQRDAGCWMSAFKEPVAVVVCDAGGVRALAVESSEIALDVLIRETPNLAAILSELSAS
jgi:hypothetical protein